jgi:hypothetical protein
MTNSKLAAFLALAAIAGSAFAGRVNVPVSAPTLSEWAPVGLGLVVAIAAGVTVSRRK